MKLQHCEDNSNFKIQELNEYINKQNLIIYELENRLQSYLNKQQEDYNQYDTEQELKIDERTNKEFKVIVDSPLNFNYGSQFNDLKYTDTNQSQPINNNNNNYSNHNSNVYNSNRRKIEPKNNSFDETNTNLNNFNSKKLKNSNENTSNNNNNNNEYEYNSQKFDLDNINHSKSLSLKNEIETLDEEIKQLQSKLRVMIDINKR